MCNSSLAYTAPPTVSKTSLGESQSIPIVVARGEKVIYNGANSHHTLIYSTQGDCNC